MTPAVLIDEQDRRLGKIMVAPTCRIIRHAGATFVRTDKAVRLHHSHRALAVIFEQTEIFIRDKLEAI